MYVSDYGFAADPSAWTTTLDKYDGSVNGSKIIYLNWLSLYRNEWTITRCSDNTTDVFYVFTHGPVFFTESFATRVVRPSFYLISSVTYSGGSGTQDSPIRIN